MCLSCGCDQPDNPHGDPANITLADLQAAADAAGISLVRAAANILQTITGTLEDNEPDPGTGEEDHFLLGVAYQPGRDSQILKGADGRRDFFTPRELEKAAWSFMIGGHQHGLFHLDGTEGTDAIQTVESSIYRNPIPWIVDDDLWVRKGTWTVGVLTDDKVWDLKKQGRIRGMSPQGGARQRGNGSGTLT